FPPIGRRPKRTFLGGGAARRNGSVPCPTTAFGRKAHQYSSSPGSRYRFSGINSKQTNFSLPSTYSKPCAKIGAAQVGYFKSGGFITAGVPTIRGRHSSM